MRAPGLFSLAPDDWKKRDQKSVVRGQNSEVSQKIQRRRLFFLTSDF